MTALATYAGEASRLYVGLVLIAAVAGKAGATGAFRTALAGMTGLPDRAAGAVAVAVIGAEAATLATLLLAPRPGMIAACGLFALFGTAVLVALVRGRKVACNCFGGGGQPLSALDLIRNLVLIGACALFLRSPPAASLQASAWLLLLGVALIACLISIHLDEIVVPGP
jgi:hypothetical protein